MKGERAVVQMADTSVCEKDALCIGYLALMKVEWWVVW